MTRFAFAAVASLLLMTSAAQAAPEGQLSRQVKTDGLNLKEPADAKKMLYRLERAALEVCGSGRGSAKAVQDDTKRSGCYAEALTSAVRSINAPALSFAWSSAYPSTIQVAASR